MLEEKNRNDGSPNHDSSFTRHFFNAKFHLPQCHLVQCNPPPVLNGIFFFVIYLPMFFWIHLVNFQDAAEIMRYSLARFLPPGRSSESMLVFELGRCIVITSCESRLNGRCFPLLTPCALLSLPLRECNVMLFLVVNIAVRSGALYCLNWPAGFSWMIGTQFANHCRDGLPCVEAGCVACQASF